MKAISRVLIAMVAAIAALFVSTGTSHAGLDNELSLVDGQGRTLTIQQWDTFLNGVFPLDRNRLTREWFHSGRAKYNCAGKGCDEFGGTRVLHLPMQSIIRVEEVERKGQSAIRDAATGEKVVTPFPMPAKPR